MSRNLCQTNCDFCDGRVSLEEPPRPIRHYEAGRYYNEFEGMLVADAECNACGAKYLAWVDETTRFKWGFSARRAEACDEPPFVDLSFRSTFNDEPGKADMPFDMLPVEVKKLRDENQVLRDKLAKIEGICRG